MPAAAQERGRDGQVNVIYWQAPSSMNPYLSGGIKEVEAASLVLEPLARHAPDGQIVPWLARAVPTAENGGIAPDMTAITWQLRDDLRWSDGSPLTARDVAFTWEYCTAPGVGCAQADKFRDVVAVEAPDPHTVRIRFSAPKPYPYGPFVGAQAPILQAAQFANCLGAAAPSCTQANFAPIGTGPFRVTEFRANDAATFEANPHYRHPARPAFARLLLKGGGSAQQAGRAVLETGEFDYAWNLQLAPDMLKAMEARGRGAIVTAFGTLVERLVFNLTDPDPALGEARSTTAHPHPILSDPNVRQALALALDRRMLVEIGYGAAGRTTCNLLPAPPAYASERTAGCEAQDLDAARALLEAAGWRDSDGDGVRDRDGRRLVLDFQTSANAVRQDFQVLIKHWWQEIGVETRLRNIDATVFFGADPASPDTYQKFNADVQMYAGSFDGTDPEAYLAGWTCAKAPHPESQWQGTNIARWCDPAYDALAADLAVSGTLEERAALARAMNDMLVMQHVVVPLVDRGRVSAVAATLGGVRLNPWDSELWNAAEWYRKAE